MPISSIQHWRRAGRPPKWRGREASRIIRAADAKVAADKQQQLAPEAA